MTSHQTGKIEVHWNDPSSGIFLSQTQRTSSTSSLKKSASSRRLVYGDDMLAPKPLAGQVLSKSPLPPFSPSKIMNRSISVPPTNISVPQISSNPLNLMKKSSDNDIFTTFNDTTNDCMNEASCEDVRHSLLQIIESKSNLSDSVHKMLGERVKTNLLLQGQLENMEGFWLQKLSQTCRLALTGNISEAKAFIVEIMCAGVVTNCVRWCPVLKTLIENLAI
ncbi:hypothetical protein POMI540_0301 [Schizosaccharomyces pombe]|uniref:Uncharacterized protein C24H6.08 n=1 Tax=Schizosaccharomyces pombe (strain 972 / ATCC 24843) TaxID=284812 RepID=YA78_SCHPO|nr:uncharacterized protein SPAC24H6.08 [Schizosaccharomyces pombe]Q09762.1 RecName: Full=Uncharacterized protein C24H6.08 [Schizosaccharomyces pombe 972h-]CAA90852.1 sequence orphan [Schizosaccharomyces pombe]|eukprot:NP_592944.1 uncharacterized protein SPAC24H6.08 [Schizosaccharomyces pombe]